jgi:death-on-curing protein
VEPIWLEISTVLQIHAAQINRHGGDSGVRDAGLLESALARPHNRYWYSDRSATVPELTASLAFSIARNHPFVDGNKRVALAASIAFLETNQWRIQARLDEVYEIFLSVAAGGLSEDQLVDWFNANAKKIDGDRT